MIRPKIRRASSIALSITDRPGAVRINAAAPRAASVAPDTAVPQSATQYSLHEVTGLATVYPVATSTAYRNADGTGAETTSYAYTWVSGTNEQQLKNKLRGHT